MPKGIDFPPKLPKSDDNAERQAKLRAELTTLEKKERRTKAGSMDHDQNEKEVLAREQEIRALETEAKKAAEATDRSEEIT
ncbi:MAG: hypothetical protein AAB883_02655, partial [Patescibacteria group bacterium]